MMNTRTYQCLSTMFDLKRQVLPPGHQNNACRYEDYVLIYKYLELEPRPATCLMMCKHKNLMMLVVLIITRRTIK